METESGLFFSARSTRPKDEAKVALRGHLFTGLAVLFALVAIVFGVLYFAFLKDNALALWGVVGAMALAMFFLGWKFFRDNGALLLGRLFT